MTWSLVTVLESPSVDLPSDVTTDAQAALIRMGWQPPPNQEPTGSFLLPKGGPMKLTRHQADVAVRRLTDHYYEATMPDGELTDDNTGPLFDDFRRKLSLQISADLDTWLLLDVLPALADLARAKTHAAREYAEDDLNCAVNRTLDNAGFAGPWILRRSEPVSA